MSQGRGGPFLENILSDQTSEMAFRNEILAASFRQLGYNALPSAFEYDDNAETTEKNLINSLILCYKIIMCMDNLTLTSTTDQYLEMGINPGCTVLWIKPQFVESGCHDHFTTGGLQLHQCQSRLGEGTRRQRFGRHGQFYVETTQC